MKGERLKGALAKAPKEKAMERLSPGVYRGSGGGLVGQGGQAIQRPPQPQNPQAVAGAASGMRQPAPLPTQATPGQVGQMIAGQPMPEQPIWQNPQQSQGQPPQMPQPSANHNGQYRLSPGVYGTQQQAMQQMYQPAQGVQNPGGYVPQQLQQMPTKQQMLRKF